MRDYLQDEVAVQAGVGLDPSCVAVFGTQCLQSMELKTHIQFCQAVISMSDHSMPLPACH